VYCYLVGSARLPLVLIRGPIFCSRPIEIMQQPSCFIVVLSVFILFKPCDARMKKRSGYSTINMIEAKLASSCVLGLDNAAGYWKFHSGNSGAPCQYFVTQSSCALLRQRCCRLPVFEMRSAGEAPRDAPPTPIEKQERHQHQDLQDHCPHTTHTNPPFDVPVLWQHECAHGCSSCEYSLWNILCFWTSLLLLL